MSTFVKNTIFFIGWLLSPLTFWNDALINIPIAYVAASIFIKVFPANFIFVTLVFYWLSNILGLLMMYFSGRRIISGGKGLINELIRLLATIIVYSSILVLLCKVRVLNPF